MFFNIFKFILPLLILIKSHQLLALSPYSFLTIENKYYPTLKHAPIYLEGKYHFKTLKSVIMRPSFESKFSFFYQNGKNGDWNIDLPKLVYRKKIARSAYFFIGRIHPVEEISKNKGLSINSAISGLFPQNQVNPSNHYYHPWSGLGIHIPIYKDSISLTSIYSPIYLPSIGPKQDITNPTNNSLYSRILPRQIKLKESLPLFPIKYNLIMPPLKKIIINDQYFLSLNYTADKYQINFIAWQSYSPSAQLETSNKLKITPTPHVTVNITPYFKKENNLSLKYNHLWSKRVNMEAQMSYQIEKKQIGITLRIDLYQRYTLGLTHQLNDFDVKNISKDPTRFAPFYNSLLWINLNHISITRKLNLNLILNHHFSTKYSDLYLNPQLQYIINSKIKLALNSTLLYGKKKSYYHDWGHLDYSSIKMSYKW